MLTSFPNGAEAVVIGASGGIGAAIVEQIRASGRFARIHAWSRRALPSTPGIVSQQVDLTDEESIETAAAAVDAPRLVFVATGILHQGPRGPEKSWRQADAAWMADVMAINAIGPMLLAKHLLPKMPRDGKAVFAAISAKVGSIQDNRLGGWYGYRASKAALNQFLKTASIEWARTHKQGCILALHPGTVATDLSAPFQKGVPDGKLFTPEYSATRLLQVIDDATAADSGALIAWDRERLPY